MSNKWISMTEKDGVKLIVRICDAVTDKTQIELRNLEKIEGESLKDYKKRKLVKDITIKYFRMNKGPKFSLGLDIKEVAVINEDYIKLGSGDLELENIIFKKFNVKGGIRSTNANLHPLLKMRKEYSRILIEMGFQAMPTNNYVESSFWNFDALFQPQDHAARDAHDTFFVSGNLLCCYWILYYDFIQYRNYRINSHRSIFIE